MKSLVCSELIAGTADAPVLLGNRCKSCDEPFFPAACSCTRCSSTDLEPFELGSTGTLWSWTTQLFQPKAPYDGGETPERFKSYGIGYVQMDCGLKVESRLAGGPEFSIGQVMRLLLAPYRMDASGTEFLTYAFEATQ